jgi:hypothetical protein
MEDLETSYSEGILFPTMTIKLTIRVTNAHAIPVTLYNGKVKLIINEIDIPSLPLEEEWYIIPASPFINGGHDFIVTYTVTGYDAIAS